LVGALVRKATGLVFDSAHQPGLTEPSATVLKDYSRFGNHGVITGATWVRLPSGLWYLSFDGLDDKVALPANASIYGAFETEFTVEFWFMSSALGSLDTLFDKPYYSHSPPYYQVYVRHTATDTILANLAACSMTTETSWAVTLNRWYHVVMTANIDLPFLRLYVDGKLEDEDTTKVGVYTNYAHGAAFGGLLNYTTSSLEGSMGLCRICNRALSATEIGKYYTAERWWFE